METLSYLSIALVIAAFVAIGVAIYTLIETTKTMRSTREFVERVDERLIPLLEKADATIDAANVEILRIDRVMDTFEDVSDKVGTATSVVHDAVNVPMGVAGLLAMRLRRLFKTSPRHVDDAGTTTRTEAEATEEP